MEHKIDPIHASQIMAQPGHIIFLPTHIDATEEYKVNDLSMHLLTKHASHCVDGVKYAPVKPYFPTHVATHNYYNYTIAFRRMTPYSYIGGNAEACVDSENI